MLDYCVCFFSVPYLLLSKSFVALYHGIYLVFVMAVRARLWQWSSAIWLLQPDMTLEPAGSESFGKSKHTDMLQISAVVHVTSLDTTFVWHLVLSWSGTLWPWVDFKIQAGWSWCSVIIIIPHLSSHSSFLCLLSSWIDWPISHTPIWSYIHFFHCTVHATGNVLSILWLNVGLDSVSVSTCSWSCLGLHTSVLGGVLVDAVAHTNTQQPMKRWSSQRIQLWTCQISRLREAIGLFLTILSMD